MRIDKVSRTPIIALLAVAVSSATTACSDTDSEDAGVVDTGPADTGVPLDTGMPDLGPADTGEPPPPCLYDQGGEENRGCEPGFVCNIDTGECVEGVACTSNADCDACSALANPEDCGHGYPVTSWCDPNHGSVCTRSRAPCEPCETDDDCGLVDSILRRSGDPDNPDPDNDVNRCLEYPDGNKFCGRPNSLTCPIGFREDSELGQCFREQGCAVEPVFCPRSDTPGEGCPGRAQICPGEVCPETNGALCVTNNLPGQVGICFGACRTNADCPEDKPICNPNNGICGTGCTKDSCPASEVCHMDGFCAAPCETDDDCTMATENNNKVYGTADEVYCNLPGRPAPRIFKGGASMEAYRDEASCAPLGCERPIDCPNSGEVCDPDRSPPACVPGCYTSEDDCLSGEVCRRGIPNVQYDREGCRALDPVDEDAGEIGICCFPGCTNRILQCDLHEFCCAEEGSPYADGDSCPPVTISSTAAASPGVCFEPPLNPWCVINPEEACNSGWTFGFNSDPDVMGGVPFQEQEFPFAIAMGVSACGVTCDPDAADKGCPRGWNCQPVTPGCFQDADCAASGLTCEGEDTSADPPVPGQCKCGEDGVVAAACPTAFGGPGSDLGTINYPRCRDPEGDVFGDMYCLAAYNCIPVQVQDMTGAPYPPQCFQ